jgi:hypothetical protein
MESARVAPSTIALKLAVANCVLAPSGLTSGSGVDAG